MPHNLGPASAEISAAFSKAVQSPVLHTIRVEYSPVGGLDFTRSTAHGSHPGHGGEVQVSARYDIGPTGSIEAFIGLDGREQPLNSPWERFVEFTGEGLSDYVRERIFDMLADLVVINAEATKILVGRGVEVLKEASDEEQRIRRTSTLAGFAAWKAREENQVESILIAERERVFTLLNYLAACFNNRGLPIGKDSSPGD